MRTERTSLCSFDQIFFGQTVGFTLSKTLSIEGLTCSVWLLLNLDVSCVSPNINEVEQRQKNKKCLKNIRKLLEKMQDSMLHTMSYLEHFPQGITYIEKRQISSFVQKKSVDMMMFSAKVLHVDHWSLCYMRIKTTTVLQVRIFLFFIGWWWEDELLDGSCGKPQSSVNVFCSFPQVHYIGLTHFVCQFL